MMKRYPTLFLLLAPLAAAYNYYEFALQKWCSDEYMIHGLWAQIDETHYPVYCEEVSYTEPTGDLLVNMNAHWQGCDDTLWAHEWEKHGSCIENITESDFFEMTLDLFLDHSEMVDSCDPTEDDCIMGCFDLDLNPMECP